MIKKKVSKFLSFLIYRLCLLSIERLAARFEDRDPKVKTALAEYRFRKRSRNLTARSSSIANLIIELSKHSEVLMKNRDSFVNYMSDTTPEDHPR